MPSTKISSLGRGAARPAHGSPHDDPPRRVPPGCSCSPRETRRGRAGSTARAWPWRTAVREVAAEHHRVQVARVVARHQQRALCGDVRLALDAQTPPRHQTQVCATTASRCDSAAAVDRRRAPGISRESPSPDWSLAMVPQSPPTVRHSYNPASPFSSTAEQPAFNRLMEVRFLQGVARFCIHFTGLRRFVRSRHDPPCSNPCSNPGLLALLRP